MRAIEKQSLQNFVNQLSTINAESDKAFEFLQDRNGEINGNRWCSAEMNYKELLSAGYDFTREYNKYIECQGKKDLMVELMRQLAELNFWK